MDSPQRPRAPEHPVEQAEAKPVAGDETPATDQPAETCEICGSTALEEIRCKVVCRNCHTILRTCSDL